MVKLELRSISKSYKQVTAIKNFSYEFSNGVYGILGPNGAGKSTLMNIITRNINSDGGEMFFCGENVEKLKQHYIGHIGYMPQQQAIFDNFTLLRFMYYIAALKNVKKRKASVEIEELLSRVDLWNERNQKLGSFSGEMKQRALLAQALLGNPDIVILDEPTAGLDPMQRVAVRDIIKGMAKDKIFIVSTHVVSDIESIAKQIIVMKKGEIIEDRDMSGALKYSESLEEMYIRLFS